MNHPVDTAQMKNIFSEDGDGSETFASARSRAKKRIGSGLLSDSIRRPKLFGGSLDEYVEATGETIPLIITSTIRLVTVCCQAMLF